MKTRFLVYLLFLPVLVFCQTPVNIYNPSADAKADLVSALEQAKEQNKHVLIQIGGNWCPWCLRLQNFFDSNFQVDSILKQDYVRLKINYSKENKNLPVLAELGYPQRFGFPVLVVLDTEGNRLHTQDTGLLELDKGYDPEKVKRFLLEWNSAAIDPKNYQK